MGRKRTDNIKTMVSLTPKSYIGLTNFARYAGLTKSQVISLAVIDYITRKKDEMLVGIDEVDLFTEEANGNSL